MSRNSVSIAFDHESLANFFELLGSRPAPAGAHCGDDDGDDTDGITLDACCCGAIAVGAHCGEDDDDGDDGDD